MNNWRGIAIDSVNFRSFPIVGVLEQLGSPKRLAELTRIVIRRQVGGVPFRLRVQRFSEGDRPVLPLRLANYIISDVIVSANPAKAAPPSQ